MAVTTIDMNIDARLLTTDLLYYHADTLMVPPTLGYNMLIKLRVLCVVERKNSKLLISLSKEMLLTL